MGKDLEDLMASIRAAAPDLPAPRVSAIAARLQQDLGGSYFRKAPAEGKALRLGNALAAGAPLTQAFAEAGVSRRTGYRLMQRKWPVW